MNRIWNVTLVFLIAGVFVFSVDRSYCQAVTTVAGFADSSGFANGSGGVARFNNPHGIACDAFGNIYIADRFNHRIRKIDAAGNVTTLAGSGVIGGFDGAGTAASFYEPWAVACDTAGNVYVADTKNYKIRKITPAGVVTTVAGQGVFGTTNGPANLARFGFPSGICVTPDGNTIYVADHNTHVIRKIISNTVSNLAGTAYISGSTDGTGSTALFNHPYGIDLDNNGNIIVADEWNSVIRKVTPSGVVTTLAGVGINGSADGQPSSAMFNYPWDVTIDSMGNIFVADGYNYTIRKITNGTWMVSTYAGSAGVQGSSDGIGPAASFDAATGIAYNKTNKALYVADAYNDMIRKIAAVSSTSLTLSTTAVNNTICYGDSVPLLALPAGLTNYTFTEGGIILGTSPNGVINLPPLSAGIHSISCNATDSGGATASSTPVNIVVLSQFTPSVNPTSSVICAGDSLLIMAQSGSNYQWSNGATTQSIYISNAGTYTVTVTNANGCTGISNAVTATISSGPSATINPSGNLTICAGDSVLLSAGAGSSWLWSTGETTQTIYTATQGNYTVVVSDSSGCSNTSAPTAINYYSGSQTNISPTGNITIIQGDSVTLTASNGLMYSWSNGATTQSVVVYNSGNYTVSVTTINGCMSVSNTVQVIVISTQQLLNANGNTTFCEGDNVQLQSFFTQGNQWYFNGSILPGEINQTMIASDSGYYQVAVYQNNNWLFSDSLFVTVYSAPALASVNDTIVCSGTSPLLSVQAQAGATIDWYDQATGGIILYTGNNFFSPAISQLTNYYVEVTANNGCTSIGRSSITIDVNPTPIADFSFNLNQTPGNYEVSFINNSLQASSYVWKIKDSSNIIFNIANPVYTFSSAGTFDVLLVASNSYGCSDSIQKKITVGSSDEWFIPTTFTPNNDGKNDLFRVRGKNVNVHEMKIYDQWGMLIYQTNATKPTWDGTVEGSIIQNGTYLYKIVLNTVAGEEQLATGTITVIK